MTAASESEKTDLASRIAAYLRPRLAGAEGLAVERVYRIPGGASRETWSFDATWSEAGALRQRGYILRRDPVAGLLETERRTEYAAYSAFAGSAVPVPRLYWLEEEGGSLERPFFIMERIDGCSTDGAALAQRPNDAARAHIARRKFEILGAIHSADPRAIGLADLNPEGFPAPDDCAAREFRRWSAIASAQATEPLPVIRLAIAWLGAHLPPPAQRIAVCHGDYRSGNFLYDADDVRGVLDWEMVHLGDPLEDFAWTCLENWRYAPGVTAGAGRRDAPIGGLLPFDEAAAIYSAASGVRVDPVAMRWWSLLSHVKATAIWVTGARSFSDGRTLDPFMALIPRLLNAVQDECVLDLLGW
jgi:aminoglycoside phosphotransferase (APT) family kinase protein